MTPDTAALRALVDTYVTGWYLTAAEVRALCDAADEVERLRAKLDMPCGSCHPCTEWAAETWRRSGGPIPTVWEVSELRAERDASRTAHAALVAELRALPEREWSEADADSPESRSARAYNSALAQVRALLDRHAPTTGATP